MTEDLFGGEGLPPPRKPRVYKPAPIRHPGRNPFVITERTAISLSGGRTSAFLLHKVLEANGGLPSCARVLFANTGLEHEATLQFVAEIGARWQVPIDWVEFRDSELGFEVVNYERASRDGEPYEALIRKRRFLPNPVKRFCTTELKIRAMHRRLRALGWREDGDGWDQFVGIRADEPRRIAKIRARASTESSLEIMRLPLADAGFGKADVGVFWKMQPFDLALPNENGVAKHGNCVLCFLKPGAQVLSLIREEPSRAIWYMRQEAFGASSSSMAEGDGARFRNDRPSYAQMHKFALAQRELWSQEEPHEADALSAMMEALAHDEESIDCFCGD